MANMQMVFLGTSSAAPTAERGLSSIAIMREGELLLFDAGEGMQRNFIKAGIGMNRKMKVFVSHMHADHCAGLLGLLQTMALLGRERPLDIYGQPRLKEFLLENMRIINFHLTFEIRIHVITKEGVVAEEGDYTVSCCEGQHSVPTLAFRLDERDRPGMFDVKKAKKLGVPEGEIYSRLQHGRDIKYKGKVIRSADVVGPARQGRKIGISGDTRPTKKLEKFFSGCDVLVFESTYSHDKLAKALETSHSTATEAATLAKKARAKKLFLTHFSARYEETSSLVKEASAIHKDVEAAEDLKAVDIPYPK
ncbi:ribonuclease Z [Candidatus Nitrososphaera sp. FF02]|uniref:ribonuclease Z n=1 Tax=Candidatus Nitrososphaera sp. FF02 TaxID=3398226 RepID=UPI0039E7746D